MENRKKRREVEILAPAGTYEAFEAAIRSGADAVYAGGNLFGARAYAGNFDEETMIWAIREAHLYGRKLYLTVNTLIKEREMKERLFSFLKPFYENGLDAVLVQDLGALAFIREKFPDLAIHASTQMSVAGALGAGFLKQYGVERVVPARELSLAEIRKMKEETGLEIECFVQGALCYSYSGQCLFSSMLGGRSGNRGQCAQPCRLKYQAEGQKKPSCILSLKDIMALEDLPDLIEAGVDSFKIEGRMKKPEYVSETVRVYRKYTDLYLKKGRAGYQVSEEDKQRLMDLYNRGGSCRGYYHVQNGPEMLTPDRSNHAGIHSACVERQKGRSLLAKALVPLQKGDVLEISPKENVTLGQDVKKGGQFQLLVAKGTTVRPRTILARVRNERLIQEIQERIRTAEVRRPVQAKAMFCMDEPSKLILKSGSFSVRVEGSSPQAAKKQAVDRARVERQLRKMGNTPFQIESLEMEMEDGIFIPMQVVNELRRTAAERLEEEILKQYKRSCKRVPMVEQEEIQGESLISREGQKNVLSVLVETKNQLRVAARSEDVRRIYVESHLAAAMCSNQEEREEIQRLYEESKIPWYIVLPHIFRERAKRLLDSRWKAICEVPWKGALVRNVESLAYLQKKGWKNTVRADHHLYTLNKKAVEFLKKAGINGTTISLELNSQEIREICTPASEMVVYGYAPMMISAGCVKKSIGRCDGKESITRLKDRYQKTFYVKNYCDTCYNIIYNTAPLVLLEQIGEIEEMGIHEIRLHFTIEDTEETKRVIRIYADAFWRGQKTLTAAEVFADFTRGHYKRGIK